MFPAAVCLTVCLTVFGGLELSALQLLLVADRHCCRAGEKKMHKNKVFKVFFVVLERKKKREKR